MSLSLLRSIISALISSIHILFFFADIASEKLEKASQHSADSAIDVNDLETVVHESNMTSAAIGDKSQNQNLPTCNDDVRGDGNFRPHPLPHNKSVSAGQCGNISALILFIMVTDQLLWNIVKLFRTCSEHSGFCKAARHVYRI